MKPLLPILLVALALISVGCSSDSNSSKSNNNQNTDNTNGEAGASGETGNGGAAGAGGAAGSLGEGGATDGGTAGEMTEGGSAGTNEAGAAGVGGDSTTSGNDELFSEILGVATQYDELCRDDCEKDEMCGSEEAWMAEECIAEFCGYAELVESEREALESEDFLACLRADVTLMTCIVNLSCEDHITFYYSEEDTDICSTEVSGYVSACESFF
ncbi:MAG: hypothetical protein ACPGQS_08330 [Bradymonadia bacterium]